MKKQGFQKIVFLTVTVIIILIVTVFCCVEYTGTRMTQFSFQRLKEMTEDAARGYYEDIDRDYATLKSMTSVLAVQDLSDTGMLTGVLNAFDHSKTYIRFQLLTAQEQLLDQSGHWTDVSGQISFADEVANAPYLSGRTNDFLDEGEFVVRMAMPVVQNGKTVAVLYRVMMLEQASRIYQVNDFGGNAFVLLIDGNTGDVLLDTWHDSLGNLKDYAQREYKMGDTVLEALEKMGRDESGNLAFISQTRGRMIYLHYEPVGINHWSAFIGVQEDVALEGTHLITNVLYTMAILIFAVLVFYTVILVVYLLRINRKIIRMSITDQSTGLLNRSAYESYLLSRQEETIADAVCIYIDVNGLHECNNRYGHAAGDAMLCAVAQALRDQWTDSRLYRIGGDEFVIFPKKTEEAVCRARIAQLHETLAAQKYSVSVGFAHLKNETGLDRVVQAADEDMLRNKAAYYTVHNRRERR